MRRTAVNLEALGGADLFAGLSPGDRRDLAAALRAMRYERGELVLREGEPGATMLIVAEGTLVATTHAPDGAPQVLNRMGPGEVLGEMALLDPAPRSATVVAESQAVVYELTHDALDALRRHAPATVAAIERAAIRDVTRRVLHLEERIEQELARLALGSR